MAVPIAFRLFTFAFTLWWFCELCEANKHLIMGFLLTSKTRNQDVPSTDFNHISQWTRYISIHSIRPSAVSHENAGKSIFIISIYWANRSCSNKESEKIPKWRQHDWLLFHGHFQHYSRERVTLVTLCAGLLQASICKDAGETAQDQHDAFLVLQTS